MTEDKRRERLRFRCWHRGTREMDLLLGSFADAHVRNFSKDQLDQFEAVMEHPDPDLYNWITGKETVPEEHNSDVMQKLCAHSFADTKAS